MANSQFLIHDNYVYVEITWKMFPLINHGVYMYLQLNKKQ